MHSFLKIYQLSKFYNTPPRLVVLIKETCNEIIARASEYINGSMVASALSSGSEDITEVCRKLETTIDVCSKFKEYYFEYKNKS
jgi:dynein heavy chain